MSYKGLVYDAPGEPLDVLSLKQLPDEPVKDDQIQVKFLQAPINPSDVNTVQGKYPLQPKLPGVPGHEGVGEVVAVGGQVHGLAVGDRVVPLRPAIGTWRSGGVFDAAAFHKVPKDIPLEAAATLCINPPTALALLENFVALKAGDSVIQNGATSAVGQAVIQLAKGMGVHTINVIRDRANWEETVAHLKSLGADLVTTEEKLKEDMKACGLPAPLLGFNCVGGSSALAVTKALADGGTLVTYGGMSMQPVTVPTSLLIFKDITFRGFWLSGRFAQQQGPEGRAAALDKLVDKIRKGDLKTECKLYPLDQYKEALEEYSRNHRGHKVVLQTS